jgi:hypothetical protein
MDVLVSFPNLQRLVLANNPLSHPFLSDSDVAHPVLRSLDLSSVQMPTFSATPLDQAFPSLQVLDLSYAGVQEILGEGFCPITKLTVLDVRGCPMTKFPRGVLKDLVYLREVQADNFKLCCAAVLPDRFLSGNCHAPADAISSCDALLRTDLFRAFLSLVASLALLGNLGSLLYRGIFLSTATGFGAFVNHLCVSDLLMGVYLVIIGVADRLYLGSYLWKDSEWRESGFCKLAGFLAMMSSEVSALLVLLITVDRCLVLRFPFSRCRFSRRSAHVVSGVVWLIGAVLAAVPLLTNSSEWRFYSQSSICLPLPTTHPEDYSGDLNGYHYSLGVLVCVNLALVLLTAVGQAFIYWAVSTNSMSAAATTRKSQDVAVARRLIAVAMTDFLCWFPIGLLGLLAARGVHVPSEVNVAMAVFVLPLNSALNPFLYTLNVALERRRQAKEKKLEKRLMARLHSEISVISSQVSVTSDGCKVGDVKALERIKRWLADGIGVKESMSKV